MAGQREDGGWNNVCSVPKATGDAKPSDTSSTQFAVLALWVARRQNVPVDRSAALAGQYFRNIRNADGSWPDDPKTDFASQKKLPTATCAGLLGLAVAHGVAPDARSDDHSLDTDAVQRALQHLSGSIQERCPFDPFFLWSVEQVAVLCDQKEIYGKDWYAWGKKMLLHKQMPRGNWKDGEYLGSSPVMDTCLATLFLNRANLAKDPSGKLHLLAH